MQKTIKISLAIIIGLILFESGAAMEKIVNPPKCKEEKEIQTEVKKVKTKKDFNKDENILFLGDSITEIYPLYEIYENMPVIKSGVSGYKTDDILDNAEKMIYQYNPTKIVLLIGTNDISHDTSDEKVDETIENIKKIISQIKENRSKATIYVESLYPVNRSMNQDMVADRNNEVIQKMNKKIEELCIENKVTYIDMYNKLTDSDGNFDKKYTFDGLHPSTLGYIRITNVLKNYIFEGYDI